MAKTLLFDILRTDDSFEARKHNAERLGENTLGIEVTRPALAASCGLGNIDPQHVVGGKSSAVEAALDWPLPHHETIRLVTIRLDKDAVCAMAVLMLRAAGMGHKIDKMLVVWIGVLDRMAYPQAKEQYSELAAMFDRVPTDALNIIVKSNDRRWQYLPAKVRETARILCGEMSREEMAKIAALREKTRRELPDFTNRVEMCGVKCAYIFAPGNYENARNWGNSRFEVTVVHDPERRTEAGGVQDRWTLVRQPGKFDRQGFEAAINAAEAKARGLSPEELAAKSLVWGGNQNIVSSPQGAGYGTALTEEQILAIVREHAESGVVS